MALFEFEKIYTREIQMHPDAIPCIEALFLVEKEQYVLAYRQDGLYLLNKGPVLNISSFSEWPITHVSKTGKPFHLMKLYNNINNTYMVLEEGIIKIGTAFSTHHGCPVETMWFTTSSSNSSEYSKWVEDIKSCEEFSIVDFRYL